MPNDTLAVVLGIRPDVIRASIILNSLRSQLSDDLKFIWSGQHYSDNLKDVFFREMEITPPDIELNCAGENDAEITAQVISSLYNVLLELNPKAVVFLGDTNTVMGSIAAAQLNIPVVHIEGCMRSYDWRMPEEKYRTVIDHISDVIYAYLDDYKLQGIAEGLNPQNIVVTGNPIVDVLDKYYFSRKDRYDAVATKSFFSNRDIQRYDYYLMTCHRRENVHENASLENIMRLVESSGKKVYFPASYRTQRVLADMKITVPSNLVIVDPVGYEEFLVLLTNSLGAITDSGTVVEEACVLGVPAIQMRKSTERPQVYDVGASVKYDPSVLQGTSERIYFDKLERLSETRWEQPFGDGMASEYIVDDLLSRLRNDGFSNHKPSDYHLDLWHSYRNDEL